MRGDIPSGYGPRTVPAVLKNRVLLGLATGFGLGLAPVASGTFGALPGILLAAALLLLPWPAQAAAAALLTWAAVPICDLAEKTFGRKDDGRIVADEYLTFPICLIGIPWAAYPWFMAAAFVVSRAMDVVKPFPARGLQDIRGGRGIVVDDLIAQLYALAVNHALFWGYVATLPPR